MSSPRHEDPPWYPVSGYIHVPGIWIDDRPPHPSQAVWPRMTELAYEGQLRSGIVVRATHEGLITFRFTGTPLDRGLSTSQVRAIGILEDRLISLTHGRCEVLTFHSACLAQARGEASDSGGHRATYVTPANLIHFGDEPWRYATVDRAIREAFHLRQTDRLQTHIAWAVQRIEEGAYPVSVRAFERSLELFETFYDPNDAHLARAVNMLVGATDHLDRNQFAEAFFLSCTVAEHLVTRYWDRVAAETPAAELQDLANRAIPPVNPRKSPTDYNLANMLGVLQTKEPTIVEWKRADGLRVVRNRCVHEMEAIPPDPAVESARVAMDLLKLVCGMDLRLSMSFGYID